MGAPTNGQCPVGTIIKFSAGIKVPKSWAVCDDPGLTLTPEEIADGLVFIRKAFLRDVAPQGPANI